MIEFRYFNMYLYVVEPMVDVVPTKCIGKFYIILN